MFCTDRELTGDRTVSDTATVKQNKVQSSLKATIMRKPIQLVHHSIAVKVYLRD